MNPARLWPAAVVGVLAVTVLANAAMLLVAGNSRQAFVEPDYYRKAVAWDSTLAERARSAALGWALEARLERESGPGPGRTSGPGARLRVFLRDRGGAPLEGARVTVTAVHNLEADRPTLAACAASQPGVYEASLPLDRGGSWELRFAAVRGSERFFVTLRRELEPGP
jgi:nitrogen fixation protein FixH